MILILLTIKDGAKEKVNLESSDHGIPGDCSVLGDCDIPGDLIIDTGSMI